MDMQATNSFLIKYEVFFNVFRKLKKNAEEKKTCSFFMISREWITNIFLDHA